MLHLPFRLFVLAVSSITLAACGLGDQVIVAAMNKADLTQTAVDGNRLYLMGELNSQTPDKVKAVIKDNPQVDTIVLTAMPGSLDDESTFPLARWLRERNLNTHLLSDSVIASGAVDLYLAGVNRTMEEGAQLGVHSWSDGSNEATDFPRDRKEHRFNADYIDAMLGSEDFYWFTIEAAPADGLHWMDKTEIDHFGLLTEPLQPASNDPTPFGDQFQDARADVLSD